MTVRCIRHTGIVVSRMEESLRFYRDLLGMEVWEDFEGCGPFIESLTAVPDARIRMIKLRSKTGGSIELLQYLNCPQEVPPRLCARATSAATTLPSRWTTSTRSTKSCVRKGSNFTLRQPSVPPVVSRWPTAAIRKALYWSWLRFWQRRSSERLTEDSPMREFNRRKVSLRWRA